MTCKRLTLLTVLVIIAWDAVCAKPIAREKRELVIIPTDENTDVFVLDESPGLDFGLNFGDQFSGSLASNGFGHNDQTGIFEQWGLGGRVYGGLPFDIGMNVDWPAQIVDLRGK